MDPPSHTPRTAHPPPNWRTLAPMNRIHLPRRTFLGASLGIGAASVAGCSVVTPSPQWSELLPHLKKSIPSGLVLKISADAKGLDAVDEERNLFSWSKGSWSKGSAGGDDLESLKPFKLDAFELGDIAALLDEHDASALVARQEKSYLQPVLTLAKGNDPSDRVNFTAPLTPVARLDYVKPEDVDLAVRSLAKAASVPPVSVSLAEQSPDQDAVYFFGLRDKKPIYLYRRPDMPVQWVGREPTQDYENLSSFHLNEVTLGHMATAMNQLREQAKGGPLERPAATYYSLEGRPTLAVQCTWRGLVRSTLTDDAGNVPAGFLD